MSNLIKVNGSINFNGVEVKNIVGGFGEDKKCITPHTIATIHNMEVREINQSIKRLIEKGRIKESVHYIDIIKNDFNITASDLGIRLSNNSKNYYILSERGYSSLIKYMDDDKSWEVHDKLIENYFTMKQVIDESKENHEKLVNLVKDTMSAIMPVITTQIVENFAPVIVETRKQVNNMTNLLHDQSEIYDDDRNQIKSLIGFKSANKMKIITMMRDKLSEKYGYKIDGKNPVFKKVKQDTFKKFKVIKWEDIEIGRFNEAFAFVDTYIDDIKISC